MSTWRVSAGLGPHAAFIKAKLPIWIRHSLTTDVLRLKQGLLGRPDAEQDRVAPWLREALAASQMRSRRANLTLARTLKHLQGITQFAEPRLKDALRSHSAAGVDIDVDKNRLFYLRRDQPVQHQSLLQAALLNFEGNEAFSLLVNGQVSALAPEGALAVDKWVRSGSSDNYSDIAEALVHGSGEGVKEIDQGLENLKPVPGFAYREKLDMTPEVFSRISRALDLGQQYQDHLYAVFEAPERAPVVRDQMIRAQQELLGVHLHSALMQKDISLQAYAMMRAVLERAPVPSMAGKPVVFSQLQLYGFTLGEVLLIGPYRSTLPVTEWAKTGLGFDLPVMHKPDMEPLLVYIPGAPQAVLKEYQSLEAFQYELGLNLRTGQYQQLFASLVPQGDAPTFLAHLNDQLYTTCPDSTTGQMPVFVDEVDLRLAQRYLEIRPADLFGELYRLHLERLKANARLLAVPTADADRKLLQQRLDYYLGLGMDVVNIAAFFIPGLGEVMMAVMALQIGMEVYHGIESWGVGDLEGAWAHCESVAINLAVAGVMAGAGHRISRISADRLPRWADQLIPITLRNGQTRLWKPDMTPYQCDRALIAPLAPNALGQYEVQGRLYIQVDQQVYEQALGTGQSTWTVKHPTDNAAYQPELKHNHAGAWRLSHEQPLQWTRPSLLRRLGHVTEGFDDATLGRIYDISGVTDDALRKTHMDGWPPPALLLDTLELYWVERKRIDLKPSRNRHAEDLVRIELQARFRRLTEFGQRADPHVEQLQRRFPGLSVRMGREVLARAGKSDLAKLRTTGRISAALDNLARVAAQQSRLNLALAGLDLPGLASADSERLAEHCLHLPDVSQSHDRRRAVGRYARSHRNEMIRALKMRTPRSRPYLQLLNGHIGYGLSGRSTASDVDPLLLGRMRDIYPNMSDEAASRYLLERRSGGETAQHLFHFLANQQRELEGLRTTLEVWMRAGNDWERQPVADRVIACWRAGLQRTSQTPVLLDFGSVSDFPALDADFSHVGALKLDADLMMSEPGGGFVKRFPRVQRLELSDISQENMALADALDQLAGITQLSLEAEYPGFTPAFINRLNGLTQIEHLSLSGTVQALDVSAWPRLRVLRVSGNLQQWPRGVFVLEHLQTLDLFATAIKTLPDELFNQHRQLWRGLRLDWSNMDPPLVIKAFEYLRDEPAHLKDLQQWSLQYCRGCLRRFTQQDVQVVERVLEQARLREQDFTGLFRQINALHEEYRALMQALDTWTEQTPLTTEMFFRRHTADKIQLSWRLGVAARLGAEGPATGPLWRDASAVVLDLSGGLVSDLPLLPARALAHVEHLNLSNLTVPLDELGRFLGSFTHVQSLNLRRNGLTSLPGELANFKGLKVLDLGSNELSLTPSIQGCLNQLQGLRELNLERNRVTSLDVRSLSGLEVLVLKNTAIREWPDGVLELRLLHELDLSRSAVTSVPQAALYGHDQLMQGTRLGGCRLTRASCADLLAYASRLGRDSVGDISVQLLEAGKTGGTPEYYPQSVADSPELLLPRLPEIVPGAMQMTAAAFVQRLNPDLMLSEAIACIDGLQSRGMGAIEVQARLVEWAREHDDLTISLNRWIDIPGYRENGRWVSAVDRRRAAERIMQCWRQTLSPARERGGNTLDFSDLCLGDMPALPVQMAHVTALSLNGVRLTAEGADVFIADFPALNTLRLNNNALTTLPGAVGSLERLTRLEARFNSFDDSDRLHQQLQPLARLEWLDLSHNRLESFDLSGLSRLQALDLRGNHLARWPAQVLNTPTLRTLNLSGNQIEDIPSQLFTGDNDVLMAGTDLTDNLLTSSGYRSLRDYLEFSGNGLGYSREDIDLALQDSNGSDSTFGGEDEDLGQVFGEPATQQKARWFEGVAPDSPKHGVWAGLQAREGSESLFYLLSELKHTRDFREDRADLTNRVWEVLLAAESDGQLCSDIFASARSQFTCGDGRILLFSNIEVKVYEFNVLKSAVAGEEGPALVRLSRGLFRLGQVEEIAQAAINRRPELDPAEIRMAYRVDLAGRLELPRQPRDMLYRSEAKVTAQELDDAYDAVLAAERTPAFMGQLLMQDYWLSYLRRQYSEDFQVLEQRFEDEHRALEDRHTDMGNGYLQELEALDERNRNEARQLRERLTTEELSGVASL